MNPVVEFLRALAGKIVVPQAEKKLKRFQQLLPNARQVQQDVLWKKIRRGASSAFGQDHHFDKIKTLDDFRKNIPIRQYDYIAPYIKRVAQGEVTALFPPGEKLLMYTLSSGTTSDPKIIPINKTWMNEYRAGWKLWGIKAFLDHPALFYAKLGGIAGNWDMQRTPTNHPCGMASGLSARLQSPILKMMYCIPASVFEIPDPDAKYYASLRTSVPEAMGMFVTATPATVIQFAQLADQYKEILIKDIHDGTVHERFSIPDRIMADVRKKIKGPNPDRARQLEKIVENTGTLYPKDFWNLSLVGCWLGGTVGHYARNIDQYYGNVARRDIGLLCSEGRFTIPFDDNTAAGVLEIASHYYEFIPEDEIDSSNPTVLECHELEEGKNYFIVITTSCGLYRYNIYDMMKCVGFEGQCPVMEFLNKGSRFADLEGEKISEHQLVQALAEVANDLGVTITSFTAVPVRPEQTLVGDAPAQHPFYTLMVEDSQVSDPGLGEKLVQGVDRWLKQHNVMYRGKREDGYLENWRLDIVPAGAFTEFQRKEIARRGVSEDHYKHPCLVLDPTFRQQFHKTVTQ